MTSRNHVPSSFIKRKSRILSEINNHDSTEYNDRSPKGTIDNEIITLIEEINAVEGYVTTSSCAGRVAVFVEGRKAVSSLRQRGNSEEEIAPPVVNENSNGTAQDNRRAAINTPRANRAAGPGGKGHGNRWLYVSHSPIPDSHLTSTNPAELHDLFQLTSPPRSSLDQNQQQSPRLVKLSFSPLILHILCANLHAAKGVLGAAINAGFRESGVQSLKALDEEEAGVMVGIRTAGLGFETVIGIVEEVVDEGSGEVQEVYRSLVGEAYLRMCCGVVNERFAWNVERRERFRGDMAALSEQEGKESHWEDKSVRRERKRMEGLMRKREQKEYTSADAENGQADEEDILDGGLMLDAT